MQLTRKFTTAEEGPYHGIEWERRTALVGDPENPVFRQDNVEVPAFWSQNATNIVASKYFAYGPDDPRREDSVRTLIDRIAGRIAAEGEKNGYFDSAGKEIFLDELRYVMVHQLAAFNSPVQFNIGVEGAPQVASACFILSVEDSLKSIGSWYTDEMAIFQAGSGAGVNLSKLRGSMEPLSKGGTSSGPVSFMRGADASAGTIQSGGRCLAPDQYVYTANGPVTVAELAEQEDFICVSYHPPAGRYKMKRAQAWKSGTKQIIEINTDKGSFRLSPDHPVKLSSGQTVLAGELQPGQSLFAGTVDIADGKYLRLGLKDGQKGKERIHRLVAADIIGQDISGLSVHHIDGDTYNNLPDNLQVISQADHARMHSQELTANGQHHFQLNSYPKSGDDNPMASTSPFWRDEEKVARYQDKQRQLMSQRDTRKLQSAAADQRMINLAFKIINAGGSIDTPEDYYQSRKKIIGEPGVSKKILNQRIEQRFGSHDSFVSAVKEQNHRVESIVDLGSSPVYDVEVFCPTADDKSPQSGHNFLIWPHGEKSGSGIVVFNTRRAAKLVRLDDDHPDVEDFITCKAREEERIRALAAAGIEIGIGSITGERNLAEATAYQNANQSVGISDEFMKAVEEDGDWNLTARRDGSIVKTIKARELMHLIADSAWRCADPGVQFDTTINSWHTTPAQGPITSSNPCSEYMSNDDSACNLSSVNLLKFLNDDGRFDVDAFTHVVELMFLGQEITISFADFPTRKIGKNTRALRQIGLGYANLGALLMAKGQPYNSEAGRATAAAISALLTGQAYLTSAKIAADLGPFEHFVENQEDVLRVLSRHRRAANKLRVGDDNNSDIVRQGKKVWEQVVKEAKQHGVRNAQATVLAPTGTISFLMDCDTTGIEPDLSLIKHKTLVGGGTMSIVNQIVPEALRRLGYLASEVEEIIAYLEEDVDGMPRGHLIGAPHLAEEHLHIFDCAMGAQAIDYQGHVQMMAAVQPFISGAISKTVNLPAETSVEDIEQIYIQGWKQGLKALAIYRDGSKNSQPLAEAKNRDEEASKATEERLTSLLGDGLLRGERRQVPRGAEIDGINFRIGPASGYVHVRLFEDGTPGAVFVDVGQAGSTLHGFIRAWAVTMSLGLQYGLPLDTLVSKLSWAQFEPQGITDDPEIRTARSIVDYVVRWMAIRFLDLGEQDRAALGIIDTDDDPLPGGQVAPRHEFRAQTKRGEQKIEVSQVAEICPRCGAQAMTRTGSCMTCSACGETGGCG